MAEHRKRETALVRREPSDSQWKILGRFMSYDYMLLRYSPPTSNSAVVI